MTNPGPAIEPATRSFIDLVVLLVVVWWICYDARRVAGISTVRLMSPMLVPLGTADAAMAAHLLGQSVTELLRPESLEERS
jgi:hypothetical protein